MASMLKWLAARKLKKREDEVWSVYEMFGYREVERVNWLHAAIYSSWEYKTDRIQGILLLSAKNLAFCVGVDYTEIPLESITNVDWADGLGTVMLRYADADHPACVSGFDFDVFGQTGTLALGLKKQFAAQLLSQTRLAWSEEAARGAVEPAPITPPPLPPEEGGTADGKRLAGIKTPPCEAERATRALADEADRAARGATNKAARAAVKAASSAAYLKTHEPRTKSPRAGRG